MSAPTDEAAAVSAFDDVVARVWRGQNPYADYPLEGAQPDRQNWNSTHPWLSEAVATLRPRIVVEVGVWKGGSSLTLAKALERERVDGCVIAVDTWLGSAEHWIIDAHFPSLGIRHGQPQLMQTFMRNVLLDGQDRRIVPLPLDSINASELLRKREIHADLIHIDAGHDYRSVLGDIETWWPLLRPGGMLIGDDYYPPGNGRYKGVCRAFHEFFGKLGMTTLDNINGKCRITKPATSPG